MLLLLLLLLVSFLTRCNAAARADITALPPDGLTEQVNLVWGRGDQQHLRHPDSQAIATASSPPILSMSSIGTDEHADSAAAHVTAARREREPSLLDFLPATLPVYTPPAGFKADYNRTPNSFRPFFIAYDGPQPFVKLAWFGTNGDNHSTLHNLLSVIMANKDDRLFVRACDVLLPSTVVVALVDQSDVEKLRAALNLLIPKGPRGHGWADPLSGDWQLADMKQELLAGLLTPLPWTAPAEAPFPHYATEVFVHHLHDYAHYDAAAEPAVKAAIAASRVINRGATEQLAQLDRLWGPSAQQQQQSQSTVDQPTAVNDFQTSSAQPSARTLLNFVKATYPPQVSKLQSSSSSPSAEVAIFACYDGGSPDLTYVQLDGNGEALARLRAIAEACEDKSFTVKVWADAEALTHETVQQLMAISDAEQLRQTLAEALPEGPEGDGWADRDLWTVGELEQRALPGQLALLPVAAPPHFAKQVGDYATELFTSHLQHFVRPEA